MTFRVRTGLQKPEGRGNGSLTSGSFTSIQRYLVRCSKLDKYRAEIALDTEIRSAVQSVIDISSIDYAKTKT